MGAPPRHHQQGKEEENNNFGTKIDPKMADSDSGGDAAPVKRGRGRPKGTTKSGEPYVTKEKVPGRGRGRPKGAVAKAPKKPKAAPSGKGRGRPPKKRTGEAESNGAPAAKKAKEKEEPEEAEASEENGAEEDDS